MDCQTFSEAVIENLKETNRTTVLIVEDDPVQVDFLEHGLTNQGFKVLSTTTCDGGFRLAKDEAPDVILLDVMLPDGDGLALCQKLSDLPETADIPIIIISGSERNDIVWQSRSVGGNYFLKKPYDPNTLLLLIDKTLDESNEW